MPDVYKQLCGSVGLRESGTLVAATGAYYGLCVLVSAWDLLLGLGFVPDAESDGLRSAPS